MHHERLVEASHVELLLLSIQDMDHRGLRQCAQKLVGRVGGEGDRIRRARRVRGRDAVEAIVELVEVRVRVPRLVEVQHLDRIAERLLDGIDVVAKSVVGRVRDHHELHFAARLARKRRWPRSSCVIDAGRELLARDRSDDAQIIARRYEVDRGRPGHHERVQDRLVAVAVAQHQIAASDHAVPDDLVGGRRATDHEQCFVRAEYAGRIAFACRDRTGVIKQ